MPKKGHFLTRCCTCGPFNLINEWLNPIVRWELLENSPDTKEDDVLEVTLAPEKLETVFYLMFTFMMVTARILMSLWGPEEWTERNPIHDFAGIHHACVWTDAAPATYLTPIIYGTATTVYILYWCLVNFRMGRHRDAENLPRWFTAVWKVGSYFVLFAAMFFVTSFAVKPSESIVMHSLPFAIWMVAIVLWEMLTGMEVLYYPCCRAKMYWRRAYFAVVVLFAVVSIIDVTILLCMLGIGGITESKYSPYVEVPPEGTDFANAIFHPDTLTFWSTMDKMWQFLLIGLCFSPHLVERSCVKISFRLTTPDGVELGDSLPKKRRPSLDTQLNIVANAIIPTNNPDLEAGVAADGGNMEATLSSLTSQDVKEDAEDASVLIIEKEGRDDVQPHMNRPKGWKPPPVAHLN